MVVAFGAWGWLYCNRLEKRSRALRGRNPTRPCSAGCPIQAPVRQWRVRPLMTFCHQGPFFESHWTLDLCLNKILRRSRNLCNDLSLRILQSDEPKISWTNMKKQGSEAPLLFHWSTRGERQFPSTNYDTCGNPFIEPKGAALPWVQ